MAGYYEPDCGTAYYRSNDPIKNLKIKVSIKKVSASFGDDKPLPTNVTETGVELATIRKNDKNKSEDVQECVVEWQQKIFCQREIDYYSKIENCHNVLDRKYHQEVTALLAKRRQKNMIFTYVDHDDFSHQQEGVYSMTNHMEKPTPLAVKMAEVRCRRIGGRQLREKEQGSIPKTLIVDENPSEETRLRNRLEAPPIQVMYIMADTSPDSATREPMAEEEFVLCALKVDANGVLSVKPDFTNGRKPYSIETVVTREGFDYTIENVSKDMNRQEQDKEMKMYKEMYLRHNDFVQSIVGHEFELPAVDTLKYVVYGELLSAQDFPKDNLYVHMFTDLPKNWTAERSQQLSWVTQTCATKTVDQTEIAYFSFPFHFELVYKKNQLDKDEDELPQFPRLMIEVGAFDSWSRHYNEGYSYFQLPLKSGVHIEKAHCWRPVGNSVIDSLRRFFTGGTPEIEDPTYAAVPSTFDGSYLSKFGFKTQSTGTVTARFNVMMQSRTFMETKANKRSLGSLLESLGITAMQANITSVLEAFKRARMKMVQARQAATEELLREARPILKGELDD